MLRHSMTKAQANVLSEHLLAWRYENLVSAVMQDNGDLHITTQHSIDTYIDVVKPNGTMTYSEDWR